MFYYVKFYIKYIFIAVLLLLLCGVFYQIYTFKAPVVISGESFQIHTSQNVVIFLFLAFCYLGVKIFSFLIGINSFLISFKYKFFDKMEVVKSYFNFKQKTEGDILKEIAHLKRRHLYKPALRVTSENYRLSEKILKQHFIMLLKLGKRREFYRLFLSHPSGISIKLFTLFYLRKKFKLIRIFKTRSLYFQNPDSQVFTYIYAKSLFERRHFRKSQIILMNFLNNKRILMIDIHCSYLMNLLAIRLEKALNGGDDFTLNYKEDIEKYNEKRRK